MIGGLYAMNGACPPWVSLGSDGQSEQCPGYHESGRHGVFAQVSSGQFRTQRGSMLGARLPEFCPIFETDRSRCR